jgi:hypothetical protein
MSSFYWALLIGGIAAAIHGGATFLILVGSAAIVIGLINKFSYQILTVLDRKARASK